MPIRPASLRSFTIITAGAMHRGSPSTRIRQRAGRDPRDHRDPSRQATGGGRRRVLPRAALRLQPLGDPAGQPAGRVRRSSISTHGRSTPASPGSPARRCVPDCGITPTFRAWRTSCPTCSASSPGAGWTSLPRKRSRAVSTGRHERAGAPRRPAGRSISTTRGTLRGSSAFVDESWTAASSTVRCGCRPSRVARATMRSVSSLERGTTLSGWLPLTLVHSPLFGRALVSSGFGVGGGVLAARARDGDLLVPCCQRTRPAAVCPRYRIARCGCA